MTTQNFLARNSSYYLQLVIAAIIGAVSVVFFLSPADIAPTGITGVAVILNSFIASPVGAMVILLNIPIMYLGYRLLPGGWVVVGSTIFTILIYSVLVDVFTQAFPTDGFSDDRLLNAIFGGVLWGLSGGMVFRTGTRFGGTSTLALILRRRFGTPLSTTTLYSDTLVVVGAGLAFGVEGALYAMVVVFIGSVVSDYAMEGPAVIRTAFVITQKPRTIAKALMDNLYVGVTKLNGEGMYSGQSKSMLYVTISRAQAPDLRNIVTAIDSSAFLVIGQGHAAYGGGFRPLHKDPSGIKPTLPAEAVEDIQEQPLAPTGD